MVFVFVIFWYFYHLVKFVCGEMLASRLWNSLLFLTHSSLLGFFMRVLHAFCRHPIIISIHFYRLLLLESILRFLVLLSRVLRKPVIWVLSIFNRLVARWYGIWVWGISKQITNSFISFLFLFTFTLLLYSSFEGIFWVRVLQTF